MLAVGFSVPVHQHGLHAHWKARAAQIVTIERSVTSKGCSFSLVVLVCLQITVREKIALIPICRHKVLFIKTTNWYSFIAKNLQEKR